MQPAIVDEDAPTEAKPKAGRRSARPAAKKEDAPTVDLSELPKPAFRKVRGRRDSAQVEEPAAQEPVKVKVSSKPLVSIPSDAPQIVLREGVPTLVRDGRAYPSMAFFGSCSDEKRAATVFEELRLAGEAGVHVHSLLVDLEVDEQRVEHACGLAAFLLDRAMKSDSQAQVLFRVVFVAPRGWEQTYPEARYRTAEGDVAEPSVSDDAYWTAAQKCLETFVRKLRLLPHKDAILGVHLERGEWFLPSGSGHDDSKAAKAKFREWVRTRYSDDVVALRASWFNGHADFDSVEIPAFQPEGSEGDRFVRSSRKQRSIVDYNLFLSDMTAARLADLAYGVKQASEGYFLVGASYGYTFEWAHPTSGHLGLGKLLRTPEIDFIAGPPSYRDREPGGSSAFPCPIDSFALNGKMYVSEEDFKTSIGVGNDPDDFNPVIKTPQALENVHWRGVGSALAHGAGITWMDLWGHGWLKTPSIWDRAARAREALCVRMGARTSDPDVAVFIDERALAYLVDPNAFRLLVQDAREAVLRSGMSAGFYLLSDLAHRERFPESKLYLFLNAWDIRPDLRSAIKERLQRDGKVLFWLYSAGLFDAGRDSLERARDVTGIALKPQPFHSRSGTTLLNRRHPLIDAFPSRSITASALEPSYFGISEDALVLGEYTHTGLPSFLVKEIREEDPSRSWTSVFLGEPVITPALVRALGQMAGAHTWNFQDDLVHVRPPFLTVHCAGSGPRAITLPNKWSAYNLISRQWTASDSTQLRFNALDGSTHVFLVGIQSEIEALLTQDLADLLKVDELPDRTENTRLDLASFDVPIMRLDEWIEGGASEDAADDWLLRPKLFEDIDAEPSEPDRSTGRRRRRRPRRGDSAEETAGPRFEATDVQAFEELDLSVRFRKRQDS